MIALDLPKLEIGILSQRNSMPRQFEFNLSISAKLTHRIYEGQARFILVYTDAGLKLQLPAQNFINYVSDAGIQGRFRVEITEENKLISLRRLD